jgi:transcriptional regulator with XRE-family HTH domain
VLAGLVIAEARSRAGLGLRELARLAGTSHATLRRYEQGLVDARVATLERIVAVCGFELRVLLEPPDTSRARLERVMSEMTPAERLASLRNVAALRGAAATGDERVRPRGASPRPRDM